MTDSVVNQIISFGERRSSEELKSFVDKLSTKSLKDALQVRLGRSDFTIFWNYLLQSFDLNSVESCDKRFACVKFVLDGVLRIELSYKQAYDLITRLCQELSTFSSEHLIQIVEYCLDCLRAGDPKCLSWKDLLPETLRILISLSDINVNGIKMTGIEYRHSIVRTVFTMRWPMEILTPLADMFKDIELNSNELHTVLNKFSDAIQSISPQELPALSFQLFGLCTIASDILIPIFALEKYFYRFYYKKLYADMCSNSTDFDSIDSFSDKELREAEETILYHLNYCTQYKISEIQLCTLLKNFSSLPDVILTPFVMSAMLTMSAANRESDIRLSNSPLVHFLRLIVKNNEAERNLADYSVWCRDTLQKKQVNLDDVFSILISQNKDGKDVVTPGLVNLIFLFLKTKHSPDLNNIAITFLTKFIRNRYVFGQGIVKKIAEWMIVEQDANQFSECLTLLSVADTFTISECIKTIKFVMDFFLWVPGVQAMRMMSFIFPILKISPLVRDNLIEVLRKAMNSSNVETVRMGVYGFCMILKQLNNNNSLRSQLGVSSFFTQQSISGFSIMSQATLGSRSNPQRHFDMLTLDIIGILRNCFTQPAIIKMTLYENLQRAVELNPKLVPHILQFIEFYFRSYFVIDSNNDLTIKFKDIILNKENPEKQTEVTDNFGKLLLFVSHCLFIFEKYQSEYDVRDIKRIFDMAIEKLIAKEIKFEEPTGTSSTSKKEEILQQISFIEGLLAYLLLMSKRDNEYVRNVLPLFRIHQKLLDNYKVTTASKKGTKKLKGVEDSDSTFNATTSEASKKTINKIENTWDLVIVERFLRLILEEIVPFTLPQYCSALRSNVELVRYILDVAAQKVESVRLEPEYKQLKHSKRTLKYLTDITKIIYERCIIRLPDLWSDFDVITAALASNCFYHCLNTANTVYKKNFSDTFVKGFDFHVVNNVKDVHSTIHDIIDQFMNHNKSSQEEDLMKNGDARKILQALLKSLDILYDNLTFSNRVTTESYSWLFNFCKEHTIDYKELCLIHKLLFIQRQKTHSGAFFNVIAIHLGKVLGTIQDTEENEQSFCLKSITIGSAESCLQHLFITLKKQIEDIEYFITKANSTNFKIKFSCEEDRDMCIGNLRSLERSICSQLVHVSNTFLYLTNVCIPLGALMDCLSKLLMQLYTCLKNLTRHFLTSCSVYNFSTEGTKFDVLLRIVGKPLPSNIYALITYIEANVLDDEKKKKSNPQAEKAKVLKETKFIPKLILSIENFNKHVIFLGKKTKSRISNLLHLGTVRDFRIKTGDLKAAIERTLSHSNEIELCESDLGKNENQTDNSVANELMDENNSEDERDNISARYIEYDADPNNEDNHSDIPTPDTIDELENETNKESATQLLKNLAKINQRAKKRNLKDTDLDAKSVQPTKRRSTRSVKK